jgi:uncharacterized membrane protein
MDKSLHWLDRHFNLPRVREVEWNRPLTWLKRGAVDLRANPVASLAYGLLFALIGYFIIGYTAHRPYLVTASVSGFFLIGPLVAAGFYEISRRYEAGESAGLMASTRGLLAHREGMLSLGLVLMMVALGWERTSAIIFALLVPDHEVGATTFVRQVFLSGDYPAFLATYIAVGGATAAVVFASTVVAVPMLMDRKMDIVTAMATSVRAVIMNLPAMLLWAALIVVLISIGFATMLIGMIVLLPLVGHATWHAYRDVVV